MKAFPFRSSLTLVALSAIVVGDSMLLVAVGYWPGGDPATRWVYSAIAIGRQGARLVALGWLRPPGVSVAPRAPRPALVVASPTTGPLGVAELVKFVTRGAENGEAGYGALALAMLTVLRGGATTLAFAHPHERRAA